MTHCLRGPHPHLWCDASSQQRIYESNIVVEACFVDEPGGSVGEDSRPGDGEAVVGHAQVLKGHHILSNLVVTVACHVSIVIIPNPQWGVGKGVPDAKSFAICSPCTLDLRMTKGGLSHLNKHRFPNVATGSLLCLPHLQLLKLQHPAIRYYAAFL